MDFLQIDTGDSAGTYQHENVTFDQSRESYKAPKAIDLNDPKPVVTVPPEPFNAFETSLAEVENAQKVGLKDGMWTAHASPEGGLDTIGYGHKITQAEQDAGTYKDGISNDAAIKLFRKDIKKHADIVRKNVKDFDTFPQKYQDILVNIAFNTGSVTENEWPSLLKAMRAGDDKTVREQSITSFVDPQGKRQPLKTRAKKIADAAGLGN